jgi:hypothetical protein
VSGREGRGSSDTFFIEPQNPIKFLNENNGADVCVRTVTQFNKNSPIYGNSFHVEDCNRHLIISAAG